MANPIFSVIHPKNTLYRTSILLIFLLLLSLLYYRFSTLRTHGVVWLLAFLCESWFTFIWLLSINTKWNPVYYKTYPQRLSESFPDLPPLDIFVTTADHLLEPPIITVNTVLSFLAVDYPAHKLACYVSDDGGSPITFYSLVEASKFAKLWVPFCKKYDIQVRAPFAYFSKDIKSCEYGLQSDFLPEWVKMKNEYEELTQRITEAIQNSIPCHQSEDFTVFSKIERENHQSIVKVIWENKNNGEDGLPHLIYVSREKRPKHPPHYKAGAMNALIRVSGVLTNAPFMLNVDCDMYANNAQLILHAMCLLLGHPNKRECGFVQFPQHFYEGLRDDPFGNQFVVATKYLMHGMAGLQGPVYCGTGCFHRREVIYGSQPSCSNIEGKKLNLLDVEIDKELSQKKYGNSIEFLESTARIMSEKGGKTYRPNSLSSYIEAAKQVADCNYEFNTLWGKEVGLVYGSTTEDVLTGLRIQGAGWGSTLCTPEPPAFLGCAPRSGPDSLVQHKRWATGLLEVLVGNNSPLLGTLTNKLQFRQSCLYVFLCASALCSIPELCYAALPAFCLLTNTSFLPKVSEPAFYIPVALFVFYNLHTLMEYLSCGLSFRAWWNNMRMQRINSATAWVFGLLGVICKLLGLSETVFEVTRKEGAHDPHDGTDAGRFTFNSSPIFVPSIALVLLHMTAIFVTFLRVQPQVHSRSGSGFGEVVCSVWVLVSFLPVLKGLFGKGSCGIPWPTVCKGALLAFPFFYSCKSATNGLVDY